MDELRTEQTGATKVNYSLGYHLRNGMFGRDGALGTDLSVNPKALSSPATLFPLRLASYTDCRGEPFEARRRASREAEMGEASLGLIVIVFIVGCVVAGVAVSNGAQQQLQGERKQWERRLESEKRESQQRLEDEQQRLEGEKEKWKQTIKQREEETQRYHDQRERTFQQLVERSRDLYNAFDQGMLSGRRWLANAVSEFVDTRNLELECWLAVKPQTAQKSAEQVAELRQKHRATVQRMKLLEYQLA